MSNDEFDCYKDLVSNCVYWAKGISKGTLTLAEVLEATMDIEYVVSSSKEYLGAVLLVSFGGPNIRIDTRWTEVEGVWGSDRVTRHFDDNIGLYDYLEDLYYGRVI